MDSTGYSSMKRSSSTEPPLSSNGVTELAFTTTVEAATVQPVSEFRTVLPQVLASTAKNLILLDLGMTLALPTIVIAALLNSQTGLNFSEDQASWFGSVVFICQPAGSVVSGLLFEPLGRKRAMLLVNFPHILAWLLLYYATSITQLYVAAVIMGLGVGFMEAPVLTYVGEISQPKWRGTLASYAGIFVTLGYVFVFFLGTVTDWQTAALISAGVPVISVLFISQVPESPIWLLSKGRLEEAERSLCWLRGWVVPELVKEEFQELRQHNFNSNSEKLPPANIESFRIIPQGTQETSLQVNSTTEKMPAQQLRLSKIVAAFRLDELCRRQTLQPLLMVIVYFFFHHCSGITSTRPFLVRIFQELGSPLDAHVATVISSVVGIFGNVIIMVTVGRLGKKMLSFISMGACAVLNLALCAYGFCVTQTDSLAWIPVSCYVLLTFAWSAGIGQVPWMLTSEVFPFRGRGVASGVAASASYVIGFIVTKTYLDLHHWLSLPGVFGFYGVLSILGCAYFYYFLPETEGKSLEEIETILEKKFLALKMKMIKKK